MKKYSSTFDPLHSGCHFVRKLSFTLQYQCQRLRTSSRILLATSHHFIASRSNSGEKCTSNNLSTERSHRSSLMLFLSNSIISVKNFTAARHGKIQRCANRWNLSLQNGNNDKTRDITWVAKQISFDHVDFRDYRRIAGDNPSVTDGCKLAIRWEYNCHLRRRAHVASYIYSFVTVAVLWEANPRDRRSPAVQTPIRNSISADRWNDSATLSTG